MAKTYAYNPFTDEFDIVSQSLTVTGTVDGSNTTFSCPVEPTFVNIDGLVKPRVSQNTPSETYWSWSGGVLTIDSNSTPYQFIIPLK